MYGINIKKAETLLSEQKNQLKLLSRIIFEIDELLLLYKSILADRETEKLLLVQISELTQRRKEMLECISALRRCIEAFKEAEEKMQCYENNYRMVTPKPTSWIKIEYSDVTRHFLNCINV